MNENNNSNAFSIKDLFILLLSKIKLILIITICSGIIAFAFTKAFIPSKFSSNLTMYVQSYDSSSGSSDDKQNITESKQLVNTYIEVLRDDAVMYAVINDLLSNYESYLNDLRDSDNSEDKPDPTFDEMKDMFINDGILDENFKFSNSKLDLSSSEKALSNLRSRFSISNTEDTNALDITVTTTNAYLSAALINSLVEVCPPFTEKAINKGEINALGVAKLNKNKVSPNTTMNTLIGLIAGAVISVLICLAILALDNTIKSTERLEEKYKKPIIGEVDQLPSDKKAKKSKNNKAARNETFRITDEKIPFYIIESFKTIRTNITFALSPFDKKIVAISSSDPSEGKSSVAANAAISLAQAGKKVLLIDADLRKNRQNRIFHVENSIGLSTLISQESTIQNSIKRNVMDNLDLITSGPLPPNPSELLGSSKTQEILNSLINDYDSIIIDTPPINIVSDALELAKVVSGIILVVKYESTTVNSIDVVMKKLEFASIPVLGFVLNGIKQQANKKYYHSRYYNYSKHYYSDNSSSNNSKSSSNDSSNLS